MESGGGRGSYMLMEVLVISYRERNPTWIHEYDVDIVPLKGVYIHIAYTHSVYLLEGGQLRHGPGRI